MKKFWSYVVFIRGTKFWLVKFPNGYCLVWWWQEGDESPHECLEREIFEEVAEKQLIQTYGLIEVPCKYSFTISKWDIRKGSSNYTEEHTIYIMFLPIDKDIFFVEKWKEWEFIWLDKDDFLSEDVMPFEVFRDFLRDNVLPYYEEKQSAVIALHLGHNASASLSIDWKMISLIHEEKFDNIKNSWFFPSESIKYLLRNYKIPIASFVISASRLWKGILNYQELENRSDAYKNKYSFRANNTLSQKLLFLFDKFLWPIKQKGYKNQIAKSQKKNLPLLIKNIYNSTWIYLPQNKVLFSEHHISHALSPIFFYWLHKKQDPYLIFTLDWSWDKYCATVSIRSDWKLNTLSKTPSFASLWYLWAYVTMGLWMKQLEHEYKVMWLAAYSHKKYFMNDYKEVFKNILELDGIQRKSSIPMNRAYMYLKDKFYNRRFDNIAAALQFLTEDLVIKWIQNGINLTWITTIVLSWGVFMNVKLNKKIQEMDSIKKIYFMPSCWDESNVIGATMLYYAKNNLLNILQPINNMYLWVDVEDINIKDFSDQYDIHEYSYLELPSILADLITKGEIIWICHWRGEWWARSLWNRAIIAHPHKEWIVNEINMLIKQRDFWMPFAPSILYESAGKYIENRSTLQNKLGESEKYMITAFDTTNDGQKHLKAVMHPKDKTIRPQIISKTDNPFYYNIISAFEEKTGIGAVLNTSLNIHWYPLSGTAKQAFFTFKESWLKYIVIDNILLKKKDEQ